MAWMMGVWVQTEGCVPARPSVQCSPLANEWLLFTDSRESLFGHHSPCGPLSHNFVSPESRAVGCPVVCLSPPPSSACSDRRGD